MWARFTPRSTHAVGAERLQQLQGHGFCIIPDIAPPSLIEHTRACAERAIAAQDAERLARTRSPGTLIDSDGYPELGDLIGNPAALDELHRMGLTDIKFWKAVIISKPLGGPRLYWHQDCMPWQDPRSYSDAPGMIFLMYYPEDTSRHNGCLTPRTLSRGHPEWRRHLYGSLHPFPGMRRYLPLSYLHRRWALAASIKRDFEALCNAPLHKFPGAAIWRCCTNWTSRRRPSGTPAHIGARLYERQGNAVINFPRTRAS